MKKFVSLLMALILLLVLCATLSAASVCAPYKVTDGFTTEIDRICYEVTSQKERTVCVKGFRNLTVWDLQIGPTVEIIDTNGVFLASSEMREQYIKNHDWHYTVTSIREGSFEFCDCIATVTISDTVTSIGSRAFAHCSELTWVRIPKSVTSIADDAFESCGMGCGGVTIIGSTGSEAEKYADAHNIEFINSGTASIFSDGNIWIIVAAAVIVIGGVAALVIVKKKQSEAIHNS